MINCLFSCLLIEYHHPEQDASQKHSEYRLYTGDIKQEGWYFGYVYMIADEQDQLVGWSQFLYAQSNKEENKAHTRLWSEVDSRTWRCY